jgi:uncharacterized protein YlxW (UPF0749 family)
MSDVENTTVEVTVATSLLTLLNDLMSAATATEFQNNVAKNHAGVVSAGVEARASLRDLRKKAKKLSDEILTNNKKLKSERKAKKSLKKAVETAKLKTLRCRKNPRTLYIMQSTRVFLCVKRY